MAETNTLAAQARQESGTGNARRLRRAGKMPAAMNRITGESVSLTLDRHQFRNLLRHHVSEHLMVRLEMDDQSAVMALLRDVQHHPLDGAPMHADFMEVSMTDKMDVSIPVTLVGEATGVKNQGGVLEQLAWEVEISCLPDDMVESFELDVAALHIGETLTAADIKLDARFALVSDPTLALATVVAPRVEAETAEGEAATKEPEVIGKKTEPETAE